MLVLAFHLYASLGMELRPLDLAFKGLYDCTLSAVQFCWCLTILYIMFWIFSPTLISHIHPNSYLRNFVLSFIFETIKSDQRCPGCMDNHWNLSDLPEATPLNNTSSPFPDSHHVQVAPQLGVALRALFHHSWWDFFFWFNLAMSSACYHYFCEFTCAAALLCHNTASLSSLTNSGSYVLFSSTLIPEL